MNRKYKENVPVVDPKKQLLYICDTFLKKEAAPYTTPEIEVRFGTKGIKRLTKIDFDNVIKKVKSLGFTSNDSKGEYALKIDSEFLDVRTGEFKSSNIRTQITGITAIQEYCKTNDIQVLIKSGQYYNIEFQKKIPVFVNDQIIRPAEFDDFNCRVMYSLEEEVAKKSNVAKDIVENWLKTKKGFRYINRVSFTKPGVPFRFDLSIVKSSNREKVYNTTESNVFTNQETYEIEVELINKEAKLLYTSADELKKGIELMIKYVLSGLQKTNYPISYKEQNIVLQEYMRMIHGEQYNAEKRIYPSDFIGPSSVTLQLKNIVPKNSNTNIPNIREQYVVTDKADGQRNLCFINKQGKIYLINSSMSIMFTGAKTLEKTIFESILDGELILHNKNGKYINLYAAFDIYFIQGKDIRSFGFVPLVFDLTNKDKFRYPLLTSTIAKMNAVSVTSNDSSTIRIKAKKFYPIYGTNTEASSTSIFDACHTILQEVADGLYEYNTDGLIFTPATFGIGGDKPNHFKPIKTWEYSFKWKPPEYNTIDFLVSTKKAPNGNDVITPIFENGLNTSLSTQFTQYKTLILRCGFDENRHGYINPCQDVLDDKLPEVKVDDKSKYNDTRKPVQFFPSNPYDPMAGICNVLLEEDDNDNYQMFTEEREVFSDDTIVEFRYDMDRKGLWRWVPLRVRYDKTGEYRRGLKNYGNDYKVANDNWNSIHNPITVAMITTAENIPDEISDDDIYYNRITKSTDTTGMRNFHNLFVKKLLIDKVARRGDTLIDYACGQGGDLPKWITANLSFVFGVDLFKDNLENRLNGACARFLNYRKEFKNMPYALFVNGNSSLNIRNGQAMLNDKAVQITKAVFGSGSKEKLGEGVIRQYGKGESGFNISSCQFAIHYMFENVRTLHNFLRNIAECTKLGGYFVGTSYDGKTIFNKLRKTKQGDSIETYEHDKKIWQLIKDYESDVFDDNESCVGYKISVYQDSINKVIPEYLVNYDYLNRLMEDYGFALLTREEIEQLHLPGSSGMFSELFNVLTNEIKRFPSKKNDYGEAMYMTPYEKDISFLNRYFIYKKIRTVNAEKIANQFISYIPDELDFEKKETIAAQKDVRVATKPTKVKKLSKRLILQESPTEQSVVIVTEPIEIETKKAPKKAKTTKTKVKASDMIFDIVEPK